MKFSTDCRHYNGARPCAFNRLCDGCPHFEPTAGHVLIIKIGALGDVLRTTTLLPALAEAAPGMRVTWLTAPEAAPLLIGNPYVNEIVAFDAMAWPALATRRFDLLLSLDKEPGPAGMAMLPQAEKKLGIGLSASGAPFPLNPEAEHYFALGLSDELKFKVNRKTYHELIADAVGLPYRGERPVLNLTEQEKEAGIAVLARAGRDASRPLVGVHTGAGSSFANKMLPPAAILDVIDTLRERVPEAQLVLLGGHKEKEKNSYIVHAARGRVLDPGCGHSLRVFAAMVSCCDAVLCGDTLALHLAVALGRRTVALFGPTAQQEIDLFSLGRKIVSPVDCAPCYRSACDKSPSCMDALNINDIANAISEQLIPNRCQSLKQSQ
jgi:ADP-heptose:LPS heptosyltransferase